MTTGDMTNITITKISEKKKCSAGGNIQEPQFKERAGHLESAVERDSRKMMVGPR